MLGSATPALESWHASSKKRYVRLDMSARIGGAELPAVRVVDMNLQPKKAVLSPQNNFVRVSSCACTSSPTTISYAS